MGGSAGGFTAPLVAADAPAVVRAAVSLSGVTDLFELAATHTSLRIAELSTGWWARCRSTPSATVNGRR